MKSLKVGLKPITAAVVTWFTKLSQREKVIVVAAALIGIVFGIHALYEPIQIAFEEQSVQLAKIETDKKTVEIVLDRYQKLVQKKRALESRYQEFEIKEGVLSYLERLVKEKGKVPDGKYKITSNKEREFGGSYEQAPFTIKFDTASMPDLVEFLNEVVQGAQPLILTRIDLTKSPVTSLLTVEVDVSTIRKVS